MSRPGSPSRGLGPCGRVLAMKPCLKSPLQSCPHEHTVQMRKNVDFGEEVVEEVHLADVWDRTPMEPARRLSYRDLLELKEIQLSLPRANQLDDPVFGKHGSQYLSSVPIRLLPLLPDGASSQNCSMTTSTLPLSPSSSHSNFLSPPFKSSPPIPPIPCAWHPPHLAHLTPPKTPPRRDKPKFAFLPLLDTPPSSQGSSPDNLVRSSRALSLDLDAVHESDHCQDPPTPSLTNASLDSSPMSRTSSLQPSPEEPFLQLPNLGDEGGEFQMNPYHPVSHEGYSPLLEGQERIHQSRPHAYAEPLETFSSKLSLRSDGVHASSLFFPPPLSNTTAGSAFPDRTSREPPPSPSRSTVPSHPQLPARCRNIMVINGVEIEIDIDDDDVGVCTPDPAPSTPVPIPLPSASHNLCRTSPSPPRGREGPLPALLPSSPVLSASPPNIRCAPIRFKRDQIHRPAAM